VIDATKVARLAFTKAAHLCATVGADVQEAPERAVVVTEEDDAASADVARHELVGLGKFRRVTHKQPAFREDPTHLGAEESGISVVGSGDAETAGRSFDPNRLAHAPAIQRIHNVSSIR